MDRYIVSLSLIAGLCCSAAAFPPHRAKSNGPTIPTGGIEAFPFSDNFDTYPDGVFPCTVPNCTGPGGWGLWYNGGVAGQIVSGNAHSGAKALRLSPNTDIVQLGQLLSGQWVIRAQTFFPAAATGQGYFIVLHGYNGTPNGAGDSWAITIRFDGNSNMLVDEINGTFPYGPAVPVTPLIRGQWVECRADVNLDTNTYDFYYGGQQVITGRTYAPTGTPATIPAIVCLDLYSFTVDGMLYDTVSVSPAGPSCYANCDASTQVPFLNVADFSCFLSKFAAADPYANCDNSNVPPVLNVADFSCFLGKFAAGCSAP